MGTNQCSFFSLLFSWHENQAQCGRLRHYYKEPDVVLATGIPSYQDLCPVDQIVGSSYSACMLDAPGFLLGAGKGLLGEVRACRCHPGCLGEDAG